MIVNKQTVKITSDILIKGQMTDFNGEKVPPFIECFEKSNIVTAKHILWNDFVKKTGCQIPKIFGYIVMNEVFGHCNGKDKEHSYLGYYLKLIK